MSSASHRPTDDRSASTRQRLLNAALDRVAEVGVRRLTLEEVAEGAGTSRQTLYRHFGSRDRLIEAVILREEEELLARVEGEVQGAADLEDAIVRAVGCVLRSVRAHPLLDRLLEDEPDALLPFLALGRGPVISAAEPVVRNLFARYVHELPEDRVTAMARIATRLMVSYALAPDVDADHTARTVASLFVRGLSGHVGAGESSEA